MLCGSKIEDVKVYFKEINKKGFSDIQAEDVKVLNEMILCQQELHKDPSDSGCIQNEMHARMTYHEVHRNCLSFLQ